MFAYRVHIAGVDESIAVSSHFPPQGDEVEVRVRYLMNWGLRELT